MMKDFFVFNVQELPWTKQLHIHREEAAKFKVACRNHIEEFRPGGIVSFVGHRNTGGPRSKVLSLEEDCRWPHTGKAWH